MSKIIQLLKGMVDWISLPDLKLSYLVEILIIAVIVYQVIKWVRETRAWTLFKGIAVVCVFAFLAYLFQLTTILWIFTNTINIIVIAVFILFQPELRRALEQLGRKNIVTSLFGTGGDVTRDIKNAERINNEIVKAVVDMSKVKTGALIVVERDVLLSEYERTGIALDAIVSSQLLVNLFEHNTPLHDGAVFIRGNRVVAATCYLPLSDNMELSKSLGTRHRAAVGISEVSDSFTIIVSEETGSISVAQDGKLSRMKDADELKQHLAKLKKTKTTGRKFLKSKGKVNNDKKTDK